MIALIRPIVFAFLTSDAVKNLVVDLLAAYAERTDNKVDDYAVNPERYYIYVNGTDCVFRVMGNTTSDGSRNLNGSDLVDNFNQHSK